MPLADLAALIPPQYVGHAAGLATSVLWTATTLFFTAAGRRIGVTATNATRIFTAIGLLAVTHHLLHGTWLPAAHPGQVAFLAASGVLGLAIGDQALFTSYLCIGPRLAMLIMTGAPLLAALFGWLALGERLGVCAWLGIAITVSGIAWVVRERPRGTLEPPEHRARGMLLALAAAVCQAGGLLLSKQGIGHGWLEPARYLHPQSATLLRMIFAALAMLPILGIQRLREQRWRAARLTPARHGRPPTGFTLAACGAVVGPFLGVWMSLTAAHHAPLGIAQTLCALPPVLILPVSRLVYHEHISTRAVLGALVAVAGVALLFVRA